MTDPTLDVRGLSVRIQTERGEVRAVEDVSLRAYPAQVVALVGESGAGKSVTALSLLRLIPAPPARIVGGSVLLEGRDLLTLTTQQLHDVRGNAMAMVFQEPMTALNPAVRIGRQIAETLVRHRGLSWPDAERRARDLLGQMQIPDPAVRARAYPHQFSGGMRQRAMIAMALACAPKVIVADEPTTALDVTVQAQILSLLTRLVRDSGGALLLITHDLGVVARHADYVNVMYGGRIVEAGTAQQIYRRPRHPYTLGLLASIPRISGPVVRRLEAVPGQPPTLISEPSGCAFAPRCSRATERCRKERPPLEQPDQSQAFACWNPA